MPQDIISNIKAKNEFDILIANSNLSVIHFWAPWATQCEPMDEAMKILAEEEPDLKEVNFARVEAEEMAEISMEYEVSKDLLKKIVNGTKPLAKM